MERSVAEKRIDWVVRISVAIILGQTLFFKFSGAAESVYIFTTMGMEPWGRYGSGVAEGIAALLLVMPRPKVAVLGACLSLGVISGALMSHLTKLGLTIPDGMGGDDGGLLFGLACAVFVGSAWVAWAHRDELPLIGERFK